LPEDGTGLPFGPQPDQLIGPPGRVQDIKSLAPPKKPPTDIPNITRIENYLAEGERPREDSLIDGDEICLPGNPIHDYYKHNVEQFTSICGFSPPDFCHICDLLTDSLEMQRRGRHRTIGPVDSFLLFLHWLRSGNSVESIAAVFGFTKNILHARALEVLQRLPPLIGRFVTAQGGAPFPCHDECPTCGFIVDATIQDRRPPAGPLQDVKRYFSGKHNCSCLKSQVVTNRDVLAVHIVARVPGATHDFRVFRENLMIPV
jgi:hypothetical protein